MSSELSGASFESLVNEMIRRLGDDPEREGLKKTPERVSKSMAFLTSGYNVDPKDVVNDALFEDSHRDMVMVKDICMFIIVFRWTNTKKI